MIVVIKKTLIVFILTIVCIIELNWIAVDAFAVVERRTALRSTIPATRINLNVENDLLFIQRQPSLIRNLNNNKPGSTPSRVLLFSSVNENDRDDKAMDVAKDIWKSSRSIVVALLVLMSPFETTGRVEILQRANAAAAETTSEVNNVIKTKSKESALEEIWRLVDKYYLDRKFNDQNWEGVRQTYVDKLGTQSDEAAEMKLASEMVSTLGDKYSRVLDKKQYGDIQRYDLIGVGATLMPDGQKHIMVGAPPVQGSAAYKAGILYGDFITAVDGQQTSGRTSFDIIDQINDEPNRNSLTFTVYRPDTQLTFDVTLPRTFQKIQNPVSYTVSERRADGTVVGYIRIAEFNSLINRKLKDALIDLETNSKANAYVIDLRSNPGGAFQSAVEISSYFLDDKLATSVVDNNQQLIPFKTSKGSTVVKDNHPIVLWIDGNSASAAEVFASSLHDNCRALIMGKQKSFGKGLIQAVYGLKNGSGLVLSVAKYVTPNGGNIQGVGITPDIISNNIPNFLFVQIFDPDTRIVDFHEYENWQNICLDKQN